MLDIGQYRSRKCDRFRSYEVQVLPSRHYHFIIVLKLPETPIVLLALVNGAFYRYLFKNQCSKMDLDAIQPKMLHVIYVIMDAPW